LYEWHTPNLRVLCSEYKNSPLLVSDNVPAQRKSGPCMFSGEKIQFRVLGGGEGATLRIQYGFGFRTTMSRSARCFSRAMGTRSMSRLRRAAESRTFSSVVSCCHSVVGFFLHCQEIVSRVVTNAKPVVQRPCRASFQSSILDFDRTTAGPNRRAASFLSVRGAISTSNDRISDQRTESASALSSRWRIGDRARNEGMTV